METFIAIFATGAVTAAVTVGGQIIMWKLNRKAKKEDEKDDGRKDIITGLRVLLYDRVKYLGKRYISEGSVTVEELNDLIQLHNVYHDNLNGNGLLDNIMGRVKSLPTAEVKGATK